MTTDAIYSDARLAAIYDAACGLVPEDGYFLDLAGAEPIRILDIGCGTGRITLGYAAAGHEVTGLDPSAPMLDIARAKPGADRVTWVLGEVDALASDARFDLIVMTGNVFQVFLTDDAIREVLAAAHRHLARGGRLVFETRNAEAREWEEWTPEDTEVLDVEGVGPVEVNYRWTQAELPLVTFETVHRFPDGSVAVSPSTLRFVAPDELLDFLAGAGFSSVQLLGDFAGEPFAPHHREMVVIAEAVSPRATA